MIDPGHKDKERGDNEEILLPECKGLWMSVKGDNAHSFGLSLIPSKLVLTYGRCRCLLWIDLQYRVN